jgi:long-chain acyl-CoA synthetase
VMQGLADSRDVSPAAFGARVDELIGERGARWPNAIALVGEDGVRLSYDELGKLVSHTAAALTRLAAGGGDRIAVIFENTWTVPILILASMRCGAVPVPINARLSEREIESVLGHCDPRLILFETSRSEPAEAHSRRWAATVPSGFPLAGYGLLARPQSRPLSDYLADLGTASQLALLLYTSGTTGMPKGVMLTHRNVGFIVTAGVQGGWFRPTDGVLCALPMSHSYGIVSVALSALAAGARLLPMARFIPDRVADMVTSSEVTALLGVPTMYARLRERCAERNLKLRPNALRLAYIGGAPVDPPSKAAFEELLGLRLSTGYGLTEAAPTLSRTLAEDARSDLSVGRVLDGVCLEVREHETGQLLPVGEIGRLYAHGPNIMAGYFRDPEQTAAAIDAAGWLDTGDLAKFDGTGRLFIVGRAKELIIHSGFNVYPQEVEQVLCAHPAVEAAAVVGRSVPGNEEVVAFVQLRSGCQASPTEMTAFVVSRLAPYKRPAAVFLRDALPVTATGKINKFALRQEAEGPGTCAAGASGST